MQNPGWQEVLDRLEPFIQEQESYQPVYFTSVPEKKNEWKLFRIDPSTGQRKEWYVTGSQPPDFIPAFGLAYTFTGDTLQAFRLSGE